MHGFLARGNAKSRWLLLLALFSTVNSLLVIATFFFLGRPPHRPCEENLDDRDNVRSFPSLRDVLPHLEADSFVPAVELGADKSGAVELVVGVPTVDRPADNYVVSTLSSLFEGMDAAEEAKALVVVLVSERHAHVQRQILARIVGSFEDKIEEGHLKIIVPRQSFFPEVTPTLSLNFASDDKTRTRWRSKANLDKAFLMNFCKDKGNYYLQLEDDVVAAAGFVTSALSFAADRDADRPDWFMLEFSALGAIGKLFRARDLPPLVLFTLQLHAFQPNDWIMPMFLYAQKCFMGLDLNHCHRRAVSRHVLRHRPSLFQHVGRASSLRGVTQPRRDRQFGEGVTAQADDAVAFQYFTL